jgi:uncharacterized protein GlcG (DUF336 family)
MSLQLKSLAAVLTMLAAINAQAKPCANLPKYDAFKKALIEARKADNGGLNFEMWGTIVDNSGEVCSVAFTGSKTNSGWRGSRVISAQKANTANEFSHSDFALSTANLYSAVQPGGSLFGLQASNPVDTQVAYKGDYTKFGTANDPLVGHRIGGVNVFGGGLGLYNSKGEFIGGLGVSGDTSCADHNIAWRVRKALDLDHVPAGLTDKKSDQIIYDIKDDKSAGGFGHPACGGKEVEIATKLAPVAAKK